MRITRDRKNRKLTLSQSEYIEKVLKRFNMQNAKPASIPLASHFKLSKEVCPKTEEEMTYMSKVPYASTVGSLMYAMVCTRPDIAHAMGVVSRYMHNTGKEHWMAVKWILSWVSKLQSVIALSTTEAEYVAATKSSKEMVWLQIFLDELGKKQELGRLYFDIQSAIHLANNFAFHFKTKHIQLKYHFIRPVLEDGQLKLEKIHTNQNPADMLTNVVTREKLRFC
eukprot:PITA_11411